MNEQRGPTCETCPHFDREWMNCRYNPPSKEGFPGTEPHKWCSKHPDRVVAISIAMSQAAQRVQADTQSKVIDPRRFR